MICKNIGRLSSSNPKNPFSDELKSYEDFKLLLRLVIGKEFTLTIIDLLFINNS
jgi:hypothetical protein